MRRQAIDNLRAAIEANTERRTIDQLKAQGKRHVRVVSGEKVLQIIKAIVQDIVDREVGESTARDRERIVEETKRQFDRVLKLQTDQEQQLSEQKEVTEQYRARLEDAQADYERAQKQIEDLRAQHAEQEAKLLADHHERVRDLTEKHGTAAESARALEHEKERLAELLEEEKHHAQEREERVRAEYESRLETLQQEQKELVARLKAEKGALAGKQEKALAKAQERNDDLEARVAAEHELRIAAEKATAQLQADARHAAEEAQQATARLHEAEAQVQKQEARLENCKVTIESNDREISRLQEELAAAREAAGRADAVGQLQGQLAEMQAFLQVLDQRSSGANEATVNALLQQLGEKQAFDTSNLEERFNASLDASLDKITRTMEAATAKPIDIVVEATDVLVDKFFDVPDTQMSTNLGELNVEEKTSKKGIGGTLAALRAMRAGGGKAKKKDEGGEPASDEAKRKVNASVERLKAVRKGEQK